MSIDILKDLVKKYKTKLMKKIIHREKGDINEQSKSSRG